MAHLIWRRLRRPKEIVESTRWVFALLVLVILLLLIPLFGATPNNVMLPVGFLASVVFVLSWSAGYLRRSAPLWLDVVDTAALLGLALALPDPMAAVGVVLPALWFRSLYSSTRRGMLRASIYAIAICAGPLLLAYVPGRTEGAPLAVRVGTVPFMFLTVIASGHFAGGLAARTQATRRDAVLMSVGSALLGVTDAAEIDRIAWTAISGICAATPGLRVLKVVSDQGVLRVEGATGGFAGIPATLPITLLSVAAGRGGAGGETIVHSYTELDAAVGRTCVWACVSLPVGHAQHGSAWLLLGSPRKVPPEAIVAVETLGNQLTLALQNGQVHAQLTVLAEVDGLTGLANRATFHAALSAALDDKSLENTAVLFVDLDDFKDVNDVFGHGSGDDLLREVAARLGRATRPGDLCARLGGDEFAVLLHGTDEVAAAEVAQRIVSVVGAAAHVGGGIARVGASVGVATATSETDIEQLLYRADVAMYAAKAKGKDRMQVFEPGLLRVDSTQVVFERQLAAAAGNGELLIHYQPILSMPDGRCTAVEALVRWRHPHRGLLYPDLFLETAERIGAIADIGAYVLRRACADRSTWQDTYPNSELAIHVNVSALQLDDEGFIDTVTGCLHEFSVPPNLLVLEITETTVISSPAAIEQLKILAAHGVTIAIDDFGTGYSALTTLRSVPAQIVKIDTSLVARCPENPQDRAVIETIVKMGAQMGMRTIAEGVERQEQKKFLEEINVDAAQGYLYLRPTTAEELSAWLRTHLAGRQQIRRSGDVVIPFTPQIPQKAHSLTDDTNVSTASQQSP
jgi:diguanylate cyclase (GGDEF)-like protein